MVPACLAAVYLCAFVSLWVQVDGMVGSNGILPVTQFLAAAESQLGGSAFSLLPTICWLNSSDIFLHVLSAGVCSGLLVIFDCGPALCLTALFVLYLSSASRDKHSLTFNGIFCCSRPAFSRFFSRPGGSWPQRGRVRRFPASDSASAQTASFQTDADVRGGETDQRRRGVGLARLAWELATALDYHYWSQPLPTIFAWWSDQHAEWFKKFSVGFCLFVEIVVPFFIWAPRRLRLLAAGLLVFLQIAIAVTGNYCFFNLLTIALCLLLIDDA